MIGASVRRRYRRAQPFSWRCCSRPCWRRRWLVNDYLLTVLILILYFAYAGQAWNIMMGFAGQLSLGHAIYLGLGGYVARDVVHAVRHRALAGPRRGHSRRRGLRGDHRLSALSLWRHRRLFRHPHHRLRRIRPHRLRQLGLCQRLERPVPAGQAIRAQRSVAAARRSDHVLLRHPRGDGAHLRALPCALEAAASAISGSRSAKTSRRRGPPASTPSATR